MRQKRHEDKSVWDAVLTLNFFTPHDTCPGTLAMSLAASRPISRVYIGSEHPLDVVQDTSLSVHITSYKVSCGHLPDNFECLDVYIFVTFDSAIHDGVDTISLSIGSDDLDLNVTILHDAIAIRSFHTLMEGIATVVCQENLDKHEEDYKYQNNTFPWVLSVGATLMNKQYLAIVKFGNNKSYVGASLYDADIKPLPKRRGICINGTFHPKEVEGRITMCMKHNDIEKPREPLDALKEAGSVGAILVDGDGSYRHIFFESLPYVKISLEDLSDDAFQDMMKDLNPLASFTHTKVRFGKPYICYFSTSGPNKNNPGILKPDVVAPGVIFDITSSKLKNISVPTGLTSFSTSLNVELLHLSKHCIRIGARQQSNQHS